MQITDRIFWRWYLLLIVACSTWYLFTWRNNTGSWFFLVLACLIVASILYIYLGKGQFKFSNQLPIRIPEIYIWIVAIPLVSIPALLTFLYPLQIVYHVSGKTLLLLLGSGISVWLLQFSRKKRSASINFLLLFLLGGVIYRGGMFVPDVQSVPFALGWSEGSRYYNASLFLGSSIYGEYVSLPVLHPSRYLLQSFPFLIGSYSIRIHRMWQVILWIGMTGLGSYLFLKKINFSNKLFGIILGLWTFLYFFQGAVYYHLMVCVIIILWGYKSNRPWRTLFFILIASIWAGISRVNWWPVPALLAVTFYLLETPVKKQFWLEYLKYPLIWSLVGGVTSLLTNRVYAIISKNDVSQFSSSFTSYLVWSRLLPNVTYRPGILSGLLFVILPLFILVVMKIRNNGWRTYFDWIRVFGLLGILSAFGLGGIIVSVKIGGGGDLHNLDAFLVFFLIISIYIITNRFVPELDKELGPFKFNFSLIFLVIFIPVLHTIQNNVSWTFKDINQQNKDITQLQEAINLINEEPGDILFITERQLLTFNKIQGVALVPDYEKVFLMEMVMSHNQAYLENFHQKISEHEFSAIVLDPITTYVETKQDAFWVENNLWVDQVIIPILEDYEPVISFQNKTINLLIPRNKIDLYNQLIRMKSLKD